jgi:hypothetical protein
MMKRSQIQVNFEVDRNDRILTLSTCNYDFEDARFVVHARKIRHDDDFDTNPPVAIKNNEKIEPQTQFIGLDEVTLHYPAIWSNRRIGRYYLTYANELGIEYYSANNMSQWQPVFLAYDAPIDMNHFTWLSTLQENNNFWVAANGLEGDRYGISLLRAGSPAGIFAKRGGVITPSGVNAQYPLLTMADSQVQLIYVDADDKQLYMVAGTGGTATRMMNTSVYSQLRPMAHFVANDGHYLIWRDATWGFVYTAEGYQNYESITVKIAYSKNGIDGWQAPQDLPLEGVDRLQVYQSLSGVRRMLVQYPDGSFSDLAFNNDWLPVPAAPNPATAPPTQEPPSEPEPAPTAAQEPGD